MIRCIAILFYTGVLLHPLKPPKSRRERRDSNHSSLSGIVLGADMNESNHTTEKGSGAKLNGSCSEEQPCDDPDLLCVIFPDSINSSCKKKLSVGCTDGSDCVPFTDCESDQCQLVYGATNPNNAYSQPNCSCEATKCNSTLSPEDALAGWYNVRTRTYNVAFGRRAEQSSRAIIKDGITNPACAAINANTRHILCFKAFLKLGLVSCSSPLSDLNCILTAESDYQAYWTVDFGQAYTIISMKLFSRRRAGRGEEDEVAWSWFAGLHVFVDAQLCFRFIGYESGSDDYYSLLRNAYQNFSGHVRCDKPIRGRHVRLEKAPYPFVDNRPKGFQEDFYQLQLCELQVWVCDLGTYADHDKQFCRKCESNCRHPCDNYHGCKEPGPYNVAILKNATLSASRDGGDAKYGVDGFGAILVDSLNSKWTEAGPDPDTGETWWRVDLGGLFSISHIILTTPEGIPDFEIWVSLCIKCKEARHQPGLVMCLNSTVLSGRRVEKRLDCESTVTGRYVTLVMQGKDQQTRMSFSELQVMGVDAKEVKRSDCPDLSCPTQPSPSAEDKKEETLSVGAKAAIAASVAAPALLGMCLLPQKLSYICDLLSMHIFSADKNSESEATVSSPSDTITTISTSKEHSASS